MGLKRKNPPKYSWASLYKKHRVGSILKEGGKQWKVIEIVGPSPHGAWATKLQLLKLKNPSELLKAGEWTPAHAVRIRKGKLEILR